MNNIKGEGQEIHPRVCIIILNWNGLEDTIECLASLKKVTYRNYEVIVVDNGSEGNDVEILRKNFKDYIHIIENDKNYGFAEGCNIGVRYALENSDADYMLLLNNDTVVAPDFLAELVKVAESDPLIGIVGPKIYFYFEPNKIQSAGAQIHWRTGEVSLIGYREIDVGQSDEVREVEWVSGCAFLIRTKNIRDIGLMHAEYFTYFEDTDLCVRCRKAGYRVIYVPGARIWHKQQLDVREMNSLQWYYATRNRFLFMRRNSTTIQLISFLAHFFLKIGPLSISLLIRRKDPKLLLGYYRGLCAGIRLAATGRTGTGE